MDKIDEIIQQLRQSLLNSEHLGSRECKIKIQSTEVVKALNEIRRALMEIKSNSNNKNLSSMGFHIEIEFAGKTGEEIRQEADIDFFNAIALFICLRKEIFHAISDKFIFVFSNVSERDNVEISFASYLYRILFYFSKDTSFSIKIDSKETDILGYRSSVSGGWGETGLPIIPINAENFETFGENVFTYIAKSEAKFVQDNKNFTIDSFLKAIENKEKILIKDINIKKSEILTTPWEKYEKREYSPIYLYCLVGVKELLKQCKDDFVLEYLQYMNVLTFLLFYAVYGGIYSPGSGRDTARKRKEILSVRDKFIELYQTCNDYSMGIMQLLENVLAHAKAGIFTFRSIGRSSTRYDKQVSSFYIIPQTRDTGWDFLQIYIADIAKEIVNDHKTDGEYKKLTEVFRFNLDKRNKDEEGKKTKISNLSIRDIFWPTDRDDGYASYKDYLKDSSNIAHHYGLQIFVFSVLNHNGHFSVVSGDLTGIEKFDTLDIADEIKVENEDGYPYKRQDFDYYVGTCYAVRLPIREMTGSTKKTEHYIPVDFTFGAKEDVVILPEITCKQSLAIKDSEVEFKSWKVKDGIDKKEEIVEENKNELIKKTIKLIDGSKAVNVLVVNIDSIKKNYIEYEILAKSLFSFVSQKKEDLPKDIIIKTFPNSATLAVFLSFYSQFYDRFGENETARLSPQIMLIYNNFKANLEGKTSSKEIEQNAVVLSGRYLGKPLYNYTAFSGGDDNRDGEIDLMLSRIGRPSKSKMVKEKVEHEERKNNPHYFDDFVLVNKEEENERFIKKWQRDLKKVLETEITGENRYGVLIKNQHVHVSGVHLDRFYKVESLFTNAYWSKKFAIELNKIIGEEIEKEKEDGYKIKRVILYGYERLIEPLFINAKNLYKQLRGDHESMDYLIFDSGYHYTARKTAKPKIGGLNDNIVDDIQKESTLLIYVMSISTTCRTFNSMGEKLLGEVEFVNNKKDNREKITIKAKERYCTIIQLFDESVTALHKTYFDFCENKEGMDEFRFNGNIVLKKETENEEKIRYLIAVPAVWSNPEDCNACFPKKNQNEKAVYCTDDTSLVPVFMIEKEKEKVEYSTHEYQFDFFETESDGIFKYRDALLYGHTVRGDSHYKSYIKSDILLEKLKNSDGFDDKFKKLKEDIDKNVKNHDKNGIDIIVAPYHNTNQAFPALINEKIFDGNAHIISLNVSKIFRSNFDAEFDGYSDLVKKIKSRNPDVDLHNFIRFYYVDDQINSGETFYRTKSLTRSFFEGNLNDDATAKQNSDFDFNAVIVLIDRHSDSTKRSYIQQGRYYTLFRFLSPNLRSGGDMCPLCKQVALDHDYLEKASLTSTAEFCVKRILAHRVKEISEKQNVMPELLDRGMRRVLTEEAIYRAIDFSKKDSELGFGREREKEDVYCRIVSVINDIIEERRSFVEVFRNKELNEKIIEKIEYLISFVKSLSRPFFTYRPNVATATIRILKNIIDGICNGDEKSLCFEKNQLLALDLENSPMQAATIVNLLLACVSGLANLNSTYLLDLKVTDKILKWFKRNNNRLPEDQYWFGEKKLHGVENIVDNDKKETSEGLSESDKNIFSYYPDKTTDSANISYNVDRSFADYLRMAIFRILRAEPYGRFRRDKYDKVLLEHLEKSLIEENTAFYSLLYLENGPLEAKDVAKNGIDILRKRMLWEPADVNNGSLEIADIIANSEPYVIRGERLVPLTENGYRNAFEIGYEIKYNEHNEYCPIVSAYDDVKKQLSGKLQLSKNAFRLLETTGISISFSDKEVPKYVFVLLRYFNLNDEHDNGKQKTKWEEELKELVLRFDIKDLMNISGRLGNNANKEQRMMAALCGLRKIVILRREFMEGIGELLNNDALKRLVATSEENKALSLSKAAKHGNSKLEEITSKTAYIEDKDKAFITIHKLMANRFLSNIYRIESEAYDKELEMKKVPEKDVKKAKNPISFILPYVIKVKNPDVFEQKGPMDEIIEQFCDPKGLRIEGKYGDNEQDSAKAALNIKVNIDESYFESSSHSKDHSYDLSQISEIAGKLLKIDFCPYFEDTGGHEKRKLVYMFLLLAYNALRHSEFYKETIEPKKQKDFLIYIEKDNGKNYLVCESYNIDNGDSHLEDAKKSIVIPPWTRQKNGITLWSISRYIKRCWDYKDKDEATMHDTLSDVFQVAEGNKEGFKTFKIKIRIK